MRNNKKGFTLIELMIVVAIIAIIAAIAIPGLLRARMTSNEGNAIGSLRTIGGGEDVYRSSGVEDDDTNNTGEYGTLLELVNQDAATVRQGPFIPQSLSPLVADPANGGNAGATALKAGYRFLAFPGDENNTPFQAGTSDANESAFFICYAYPDNLGNTGTRTFALDQTNELVFQALNANAQLYTELPAPLRPQPADARVNATLGSSLAVGVVGSNTALWSAVGN